MKRILLAIALLFAPLAFSPLAAQTTRTFVTYSGAYSGSTSYAIGDTVTSGGVTYISLTSSNTGNAPATGPTQWRVYGAVAITGDLGGTAALRRSPRARWRSAFRSPQ